MTTCDFSFAHYRRILQTAIKSGYKFIRFDELRDLPRGQKACVLRHDVDYLPEHAPFLSEIELSLGIRATYFFQICARTYNLREAMNYRIVRDLKRAGHTIGLHFDMTWDADAKWDEFPKICRREQVLFEKITGVRPCKIVSHHNPHRFTAQVLNSVTPGMRHTYEPQFFSKIKYLSDSQGWYEGCMCKIFAAAKYPRIQLCTHPYIWSKKPQKDFIGDMTRLIRRRSDELLEYCITYHPVCKKNEARLRREVQR
ncbi:MAG: hypothetical protein V1882_00470 [Candidatus Omnitrophota bacterium]